MTFFTGFGMDHKKFAALGKSCLSCSLRLSFLTLNRTPEEIRLGSMHSTNKAFERYFQVEPDDLRNIYRDPQQADTKRELTE
jgi:hypothetical protein